MVASISKLPEGCISDILSLTSPWNACRSSSTQKVSNQRPIRMLCGTDSCRPIIRRSDSPVVYSTKRQLYFPLRDTLILVDGGKLREEEMEVASISKLPGGCISVILSLTSPWDACRSSAISSGFKSAADSDAVWHRLLPSDYPQILARSDSPVVYSTKKQLYFLLCDSFIHLDGDELRFMLDKRSGKKCYILPSTKLSIAWKDDEKYWNSPSISVSRFIEVANLRFMCWLEVYGTIDTRMLSPVTTYAIYLVYKVSPVILDRIGPVKTSIRFPGDEVDKITVVNLKQQANRRKDGCMEIELGEFFNGHGEGGEVEMRLMETVIPNGKHGFSVEGIEVRPKEKVCGRNAH